MGSVASCDPGGSRHAGLRGRKITADRPTLPQGLDNALLAAIVESSDDAIVSKTLDGIVTSWNPAAERLFGYAAAEMIGRPISLLAPAGREDEMPAILERIRRGERVDHFETVRRRKDGGAGRGLAHRLAGPRRPRADRRRLQDRPRHHRAAAGGAGARAAPRRASAPGEEPARHGPGARPPDRDRGPLGRAVPRRLPRPARGARASRTSWRSGRRTASTWPRSSSARWSPTRATARRWRSRPGRR